MNKAMQKLISFFIFVMLFATISHAQQFNWKAELPVFDSTGFYDIFMNPEITSKLNHTFSDIRLYDQSGNEIPYIKRTRKKILHDDDHFPLKIIENKHKKRKGFSRVLIHNSQKKRISNICLIIKSTDIEKWIKLSASDDRKNWILLKDNLPYQATETSSSTSEITILDFPVSDYEYFELLLFDYNNENIKVLRAFHYNMSFENLEYVKLPEPEIKQDDTIKLNRSVLTIRFDDSQYIDKLELDINGPLYYYRKIKLSQGNDDMEKKMRLEYFDQTDREFFLSSQSDNTLLLTNFQAKNLEITIENKDNEPVKIKSVKAYQLKYYLTAYLQTNKKYVLRFGNKTVSTPIYDLKYFKDSIPDINPVVTIKKLQGKSYEVENGQNIMKIKPLYLWLILGVVALLLLYVSITMLKEIGTNKEE